MVKTSARELLAPRKEYWLVISFTELVILALMTVARSFSSFNQKPEKKLCSFSSLGIHEDLLSQGLDCINLVIFSGGRDVYHVQ